MDHVLVINGSPVGKKGVSYILQKEFVLGAQDPGAEVDEILWNWLGKNMPQFSIQETLS